MMSDDVREYAGDCEQPLEYYVRTFKCVRDEIERLRADYQSASEQRDQVQQQYREKCAELAERDSRIEYLSENLDFWARTAREYKGQFIEVIRHGPGHIITDEQIDKAWQDRWSDSYGNVHLWASHFGIVECPACLGVGEVRDVITCSRCHGHGWIREERGDE